MSNVKTKWMRTCIRCNKRFEADGKFCKICDVCRWCKCNICNKSILRGALFNHMRTTHLDLLNECMAKLSKDLNKSND